MDAKMQIALGPLDASSRIFPYPDAQEQGPSNDAANAHSHQDQRPARPNGKKARWTGFRKRENEIGNHTVAALGKSAPRDENKKQTASVQPADGVQKTRGRTRLPRTRKKQHNPEQLTAALEDASLTGQKNGPGQQKGIKSASSGMHVDLPLRHSKQEDTKRTTRSMSGNPPLTFDHSYLMKVGDASKFMNNDGIKTWISSVSHHLKSWYCKCVCDPANEAQVRAAQSDPEQFVIAVSRHESKPPRSARLAEESNDVANNFLLRTWKVSGHVARDGQRSGAFARCKKARHGRYAAIMLLVTVVMDLTVNMGYFIRFFLGIHNAYLSASDEKILLALGDASAGVAQPFQRLRGGSAAVPRTLQVPAELFDSVSELFGDLALSTGCRFLVHPPSGPGLARYIVIVGSIGQICKAEQVIAQVMAGPPGMDVS